MRNATMLAMLAWTCLTALTTLAEKSAAPGLAAVSELRQAPVLDGVIAPDEWEGAVSIVGFQGITGIGSPFLDPRLGRTFCGFFKDRLYLAVESAVSPKGPFATKRGRDADLISDSTVELWLRPDNSRRYFQVMANPLGAIQDIAFTQGKTPEVGWDSDCEVANRVDMRNRSWTIELSIPFKNLGMPVPAVGQGLGLLVSRNYRAPWDQATWFRHHGPFTAFASYPTIKLTQDSPSVQIESLGAGLFEGMLDFKATLRNPGAAREAEVALRVDSSDMPSLDDRKTVKLPANGSAEYRFAVTAERLHREAVHDLRVTMASGGAAFLDYSLEWTNVEKASKALGGNGKPWTVTDGPDYDAAAKIVYYPSYCFVRVLIDPKQLGDKFAAVKKAAVSVASPDGKAVASGEMSWTGEAGEADFKVGDLPDGDYQASIAIAGLDKPLVRPFVRKHFPWEGNKLGITDKIYPPFEPVKVDGDKLQVVGRGYQVDGLGLWKSVTSLGEELLAGPVRLVVDGDKALAGGGSFVESKPTAAVFRGKATTAVVDVSTECVTEVDGCQKTTMTLKPGAGGGELKSLSLEIPLKDSLAPLWHVCSTAIRTNPAGAAPKGEGVVWDSRDYPDGEWYGNFKCYAWLGGEERGVCWFADNDKGWVLDKEGKREAPCLQLVREKGVLTLRVNFVQKPVKLDQPRQIVFGLMATPAKPMPKDWRKTTFCGGYKDYPRIVWLGSEYWGSERNFSSKYPRNGDLRPLEMIRKARRGEAFDVPGFLQDFKERNFKPGMPDGEKKADTVVDLLRLTNVWASGAKKPNLLNAYWEEFHSTNPLHEEVKTFGGEWSGRPDFGGTGALVSSYRDFAVWYGALFVRNGVGLYFDNSFPKRAYDPLTSSAYRLPNGDIQPSAGIWAHRDYLKRIWNIHRGEADPEMPVLQMIHMTNTHVVPYMVWNDSNLDLEWFYGSQPAQAKYGHDLLRAESLGRQSGNIPLALARVDGNAAPKVLERAVRTRFAALMVHEIKTEPSLHGGNFERPLYERMWDFGYGLEDCEVFNYWDKGYPLTFSDSEVKSLLLKRGGKLLLLVCGWNKKPVNVKAALDTKVLRLSPANASDMDSKETFQLRDDEFVFPLEDYGVRFICLE